MSSKETITVNELAQKPTILWDKLKNKSPNKKSSKLNIEDFTSNVGEKPPGHIRFVFISDTHNQADTLEMPDGDVMIHAGDFSNVGLPREIDNFNKFLGNMKNKYKHVIVISGNHELTFDPKGAESAANFLPKDCLDLDHLEMKKKLTNCTYLEDEAVDVMGFKIYGSPWYVFEMFFFLRHVGKDLRLIYITF